MPSFAFFKKTPHQKGIHNRIVWMINLLVLFGILIITTIATLQTYQQMDSQGKAYYINQADTLHHRLEQSFSHLIEHTLQLAKNKLVVNALTDSTGRYQYLPTLISNFMHHQDTLAVSLLDYDGQPIFETKQSVIQYNHSPYLRTALAMSQTSYFIENGFLYVISPIEYYNTTQGALIVQYDLITIIKQNTPNLEQGYVHISQGQDLLYAQAFNPESDYLYLSNDRAVLSNEVTQQLDLSIGIGVSQKQFFQPIIEAATKVVLIGFMILIITLFAAHYVANSVTQPILELFRRVKESSNDATVLCSPLGTHDELDELAQAFDEKTYHIQHQAQHDALTQLPNRLLFVDRVEHTLSIRKRLHQKLAVLFLDLDRFKEVNDSFGHETGDKLIQKVAIEIRHQLREEDTIARFGGDEFAILIHQYQHPHDLIIVIEKILSIFRQPFIFDELQLFSTCGIGIATFPENGADASALMKNADAAMYKAKLDGQNRYEFYNHDMTEQAYERVNLERELRYALSHNELEVYYQPQIDMRNQKVLGVEILMRWNHPQKGLIPPDQFIPFAEEIGLIVEMDRWAMEVAMKQVYRWQQQGLQPGKLSLNLSLIQLNQLDFLASVQQSIAQSLMLPQDLMFEITETQIMRNPEQATRTLTHLKELGLSLAIDDFGTGHSSLSYLKNFPIDKLKIDQSFVKDMMVDKDDANLVKAIINIAKSLEMEVIAEGVENASQAELLKAYGCYEAQGFYYSKPLNKTDCEAFLKSH